MLSYLQRSTPNGAALLDQSKLAVLLEALDILHGLDAPLDPPLEDAPHVPYPPRVALAGYLQGLQDHFGLEPVPLTVPVQEL